MKGNDFYKTYQTTEWQRKKNSVLERDDYTCQICGSSSGIMQVHHITYKHCKGKAYNAPMGDLITLCEDCHAHDDGDHEHFFNGDYHIKAGEEKPTVFDNTLDFSDLGWHRFMRCEIISMGYWNGHEHVRCVGFFNDVYDGGRIAYFPFLQGYEEGVCLDVNIEDVYNIQLASTDEIHRFVTFAEKYIPFLGEELFSFDNISFFIQELMLGGEYIRKYHGIPHCLYGVDFEEFRIGVIISAKYKYSNWRHIGFFTNISDELGAYFPFLLGFQDKDEIWFEDWHNSEDYSDIRPASLDEVQYYVDRVEKSNTHTHTHLMPFIKPHYIGPAELCKSPTETWVVDVDRFEAEKSGEIKK